MIRYLWCIVRYLPCVDCIYKTSCVKHSRRAFRWYMDRCIQFFTKWFYWMIQFCITNVILIQGLMVYSANIIRSLFYLLKETLNYLSVFSWYFFFDFMNFWIFWYPIFWYSHYISGCSWYILFHILVAMLVFLGASFFDILFVFLDFPDTFFFYSLFYFLDFHANCFIYQILHDFPDYLRSDM